MPFGGETMRRLSQRRSLARPRGRGHSRGHPTGLDPIFQGAADFDLNLIESRTLDDHIQELIYRSTLHV